MTWTNTSWAFQEIPSSAKMNASEANVEHVREESSYWVIMNHPAPFVFNFTSNTQTYSLYIDGVAYQTGITADGTFADIDISGLANGIHEGEIRRSATSGAPPFLFKFFKTTDMDYLTFWIDLGGVAGTTGDYDHTINSLFVITHREAKAWT